MTILKDSVWDHTKHLFILLYLTETHMACIWRCAPLRYEGKLCSESTCGDDNPAIVDLKNNVKSVLIFYKLYTFRDQDRRVLILCEMTSVLLKCNYFYLSLLDTNLLSKLAVNTIKALLWEFSDIANLTCYTLKSRELANNVISDGIQPVWPLRDTGRVSCHMCSFNCPFLCAWLHYLYCSGF